MAAKIKTTPSIDIDDAIRSIRMLQPDETRRRSELMVEVKSVLAVLPRERVLSEAFDQVLEDLGERRNTAGASASPTIREGNAVVVLGESGAGKSTSIRRLIASHPLTIGELNAPGSKLFSISAPSPCNLAELGREILIALGYPLARGKLSAPDVWRMVRERIRSLGILLLHLDEMQHVIQTVTKLELQKVRNNIKGMLVDPVHPIALIVSGMPNVVDLMKPDRQVARRCSWIEFEALTLASHRKMLAAFIRQLCERADLAISDNEIIRIVPRMLHAGCYQLGVTAEEIHEAIRTSLKAGEKDLRLNHFATAYAKRTRNPGSQNPYISDHWRDIDPTQVLGSVEMPRPAPKANSSRKGRNK
ncbi:MAG TPA: ATP-binding protein [Ensifer sp.]|uniref:ATP-binding protein n=1 Tax=Ensifer sp. TaxID=1872086 RepID=UPI002E0FA40F|nr:ATP-binding protein [Ensifer sp.]